MLSSGRENQDGLRHAAIPTPFSRHGENKSAVDMRTNKASASTLTTHMPLLEQAEPKKDKEHYDNSDSDKEYIEIEDVFDDEDIGWEILTSMNDDGISQRKSVHPLDYSILNGNEKFEKTFKQVPNQLFKEKPGKEINVDVVFKVLKLSYLLKRQFSNPS